MTDPVQGVYDRIPDVDCRGLCHEACTTIGASEVEQRRLAALGYDIGGVRTPEQVLAKLRSGEDLRCPALGPLNTCRVYESRPAVCRLFGVTEGLECPFGCRPHRLLPNGEARGLLAELEEMPGDGR